MNKLPTLEPLDAIEESKTPKGEVRKRRRRASRQKEIAAPSWENGSKFRKKRPEKLLMTFMLVGAGLLVLVAVLLSTRSKSPAATKVPPIVSQPPMPPPTQAAPAEENDLPDVGEFLRLAEPMARSFLNAGTVTELLRFVRHPEITSKRLNERFPDGRIQPPGLQTFADNGAVQLERTNVTVKIRIGNFEQRDLSFARTRDGWKIDWESWVGWSDMPWETFAEKAPTTPSRFRVRIKPIIYYNFSFSDDGKWRSYLIESPDGQHRFFGYVERGSPVDALINLADTPSGGDFILDLAFPADNSGRNQVLIKDRIAVGWVEPEHAASP
jgi:hypothetical protein